ncbi:SDR family oxidoreductase [Pseudomonas typographi]|uniref:SDR family oxidoreductase n=1 Tax=Pseudomonas typographi TaxID=2715964 RepID=A0ABR7Z7A1_9PSED|nr:SDR family oxidoreductase [Pseudomonas typographi]MBD1554656.1 SDR family oxidoreductase [Pseudomonas typographi]MBD1601411.1 SDR family oxidoreductase [Pseudomonas typographi]
MADHEHDPTRRRLLQGAALATAAGLATPAMAQAGSDGAMPAPLQSPQKGFPKPPFNPQPQPWPGLASKMNPRPDHGETHYRGSNKLLGRKALITGGDSGLGRAVAIAFAREGADVAINYLPAEEDDAREVVALIQQAGRKALAIPGDLREAAFCRDLVARAVAGLGGLDILVNNAARQQSHESILDITDEQFDWTLKTNLYALFWLTKAALPHLPEGAAIINTASVNAYDPGENIVDYALTKAGIANFSKGLAKQVADRGIRVNAVAPGPFWTPLQVTGGQTMEKLKAFGSDTPLKRPGQPVEIAPLYVQLASAEASYVTGQVFGASGGKGQP